MSRTTYLTAGRLAVLRRDLTELEWRVLASVEAIQIATAGQLARVHCTEFPEAGGARQCRRLLARMAERELLLRLPRTPGGRGGGSEPFVYRLGPAGQALLGRARRRLELPGPQFLNHALGIAESWVQLVEADRRGLLQLVRFVREPGAWERYQTVSGERWLKPDAVATVAREGWEYHLALEIDRSSEGPSAIGRKLASYVEHRQLVAATERRPHPLVLFVVPDQVRHEWMMRQFSRLPADQWSQFLVTTEVELIPCLLRLE